MDLSKTHATMDIIYWPRINKAKKQKKKKKTKKKKKKKKANMIIKTEPSRKAGVKPGDHGDN
jgi:hypothetical protein